MEFSYKMTDYFTNREILSAPRLPLEGSLDLTYRCNNNCRHCWVNIPVESDEIAAELSLDEIKSVVDTARSMGCNYWYISGGEPMLREDFAEIFDYITLRSKSYTLNTNGTLITTRIAGLMKRRGNKLVVIYGSDAKVHDHITRTPGSFEAVMQGIAYLREAGAGFTVQIIPMRDNYHQLQDMIKLAENLNRSWRIGSAWLFLSPGGDCERNREIKRQRLSPEIVIELDKPDLTCEERFRLEFSQIETAGSPEGLYERCITNRSAFHIDPYGMMSFCGFVRDPDLRYNLRQGGFEECWEKFIPSLVNKVKIDEEYENNCGDCSFKEDCRWCPVYAYLEHNRHSAKIEYLCAVARENRKYKETFRDNHRRYYQLGGINILIEADTPISDDTFDEKFNLFRIDQPRITNVTIRHHFDIPPLNHLQLEEPLYDRPPWTIYRVKNSWLYLSGSFVPQGVNNLRNIGVERGTIQIAEVNNDYSRMVIYNNASVKSRFLKGGVQSLTLFPTDQVLMAPLLANYNGIFLHSSGVILNGSGLLFVGHEEAGKTTIAELLNHHAEILCDDRIIIRRIEDKFRIFGTWSHGDLPIVSPSSAPLKMIMFLKKSDRNSLELIEDRFEVARLLLDCVIKPLLTVDWWEKVLSIIDDIVKAAPAYYLHFDRSGEVVTVLEDFAVE